MEKTEVATGGWFGLNCLYTLARPKDLSYSQP